MEFNFALKDDGIDFKADFKVDGDFDFILACFSLQLETMAQKMGCKEFELLEALKLVQANKESLKALDKASIEH